MHNIQSKGNLSYLDLILIISVLIVCFIIYLPALDSGLMYDDAPNLKGLSQITDGESAINFIFNGKAGPLGRPIALASFLTTYSDWPSNPFSFKLVNITIHLFNGFLLFIWIKQLVKLLNYNSEKSTWIATFTSAIWLMHPFLATTHLSIIQRMTSLSGTFMLIGLVTYLHGRSLFLKSKKTGLIWMGVAVMVSTLLASFTKENGALLPLYILILESTLLCHFSPITNNKFKLWKFFFLYIPNILILIYIIITWNSIVIGYNVRAFNMEQRLLTESIILIEYLYQLIVPNASSSPFYDSYPISKNWLEPIYTFYSMVFWVFLLIFSWVLRKKHPLILFSICWFIGGHILESTIYCLELYFEHRNYMPSISIIFMICYLAWNCSKNLVFFMRTGLILYTGLIIFTLSAISRVWSQPILSANLWAQQNPYSIRANQYLANIYIANNNLQKASNLLNSAYKNIPHSANIAFQLLQINCLLNTQTRFSINQIINNKIQFQWNSALIETFKKLILLEDEKTCPALNRNDLYMLAQSLIDNNHKHNKINVIKIANLHVLLAMMYREDGDLTGSMMQINLATKFNPEAMYFVFAANNLRSAGLYKDAIIYLEKAQNHLPNNIINRQKMKQKIYKIQKLIEQQAS